ncbi:hypothetical protein HK104_002814 [Borealophlyctis nickersoniae]|nr:hypothetical protein HK104_002814 [Borealophlyctis nickersoniae]
MRSVLEAQVSALPACPTEDGPVQDLSKEVNSWRETIESGATSEDTTSLLSLKAAVEAMKTSRISFLERLTAAVNEEILIYQTQHEFRRQRKVTNGCVEVAGTEAERLARTVNGALRREMQIDLGDVPSEKKIPLASNHLAMLQKLSALDQELQSIKVKFIVSAKDVRELEDPERLPLAIAHFDTIGQDIALLLTQWEEARDRLRRLFDEPGDRPAVIDSATDGQFKSVVPSVDLTQRLAVHDSQDTPAFDMGPEMVYEDTEAVDEEAPQEQTKKLTRQERIRLQKEKREAENQVRAERAAKDQMVNELKNVLIRRKPDASLAP